MSDHAVFETQERREEFWARLNAVFDDFPELRSGLKKSYGDQDALDDGDSMLMDMLGPFDETAPTFVDGMVLVLSIRNTQHYENMCVLEPKTQSSYMTAGLLNQADKLQ
jgi:hypothetical protein